MWKQADFTSYVTVYNGGRSKAGMFYCRSEEASPLTVEDMSLVGDNWLDCGSIRKSCKQKCHALPAARPKSLQQGNGPSETGFCSLIRKRLTRTAGVKAQKFQACNSCPGDSA